jgi:hypothetical protein
LKAYLRATDHTSSNIISRDSYRSMHRSSWILYPLPYSTHLGKDMIVCLNKLFRALSSYNKYNKI